MRGEGNNVVFLIAWLVLKTGRSFDADYCIEKFCNIPVFIVKPVLMGNPERVIIIYYNTCYLIHYHI